MKDNSYAVNHILPALQDESHLPVAQQSLVFRLRKRAEIRRQIPGRLAVTEGKPDKIANLLDEAADEIIRLKTLLNKQYDR
jgi:hypothetical protein